MDKKNMEMYLNVIGFMMAVPLIPFVWKFKAEELVLGINPHYIGLGVAFLLFGWGFFRAHCSKIERINPLAILGKYLILFVWYAAVVLC